jgi:signal transduction histidine kinase
VKFTEHGSVSLAASRAADGGRELVKIEVSDTGVGISVEALGRIFDPFVQVDGSTTRRHGGSGLGLAIVRDLARMLGGRVEVASRPGIGSTFTVYAADLSGSAPIGTLRA